MIIVDLFIYKITSKIRNNNNKVHLDNYLSLMLSIHNFKTKIDIKIVTLLYLNHID